MAGLFLLLAVLFVMYILALLPAIAVIILTVWSLSLLWAAFEDHA